MLSTILILDSPRGSQADLLRSLETQVDPSCRVEMVLNLKTLQARLTEVTTNRLALVPVQFSGDESGSQAGTRALKAIRRLRKAAEDLPIVAVAPAGDVADAAAVVTAGASDLLVTGSNLDERVATLLGKMNGLLEIQGKARLLSDQNAQLQLRLQAEFQIVGLSPQIRNLVDRIRAVAKIPRPLLIIGERGTGKELVAQAIHSQSLDGDRPLVTVNCAAFGDALLESELFGHERGAFTGAMETKDGKFALADGGTLFLDEIGHMSLSFQQKILRVVEYGTYTRIGGHRELKTSARIIAATNADLRREISAGRFISDLYDRLAFETIEVPSLRDREGDVEVLAQHFLERFALEIPTLRGKQLADSALLVLRQYHFPGNIRELKNIIERAACRDTTNEITPEDIGMLSVDEQSYRSGTYKQRVDAFRRHLLNEALKTAAGNQAAAARQLGLTYDQFRYQLRKFAPAEFEAANGD